MIDRIRRDRMGELLRGLASGAVTEEDFIDQVGSRLAQDTNDSGVLAAYEFAESLIFNDDHFALCRRPLSRTSRRQLAIIILFLHSDSEYEWPDECLSRPGDTGDLCLMLLCGICISIAMLTLIAVQAHLIVLAVHVTAVVLALLSWLWSHDRAVTIREDFLNHQKQVGDIEVWPFLTLAAFDNAKAHPRLLVGR